jgi:hypothetical protein
MHIGILSGRVLETRMQMAALAVQVGGIAALLSARRIATRYRCERPPSDEAQHLPFIRLADAVVNSDDTAMPAMASDRITTSFFMMDLPD